jgi:hypothetical protein
MQEVVTTEQQNIFLDSYFVCANRPPERQKFLRGIAADMFKRSYTAAFFMDQTMVGGFCLVLEPPLTELKLLPADVRDSHPFLKDVKEQEMVSLPMLWLNKDMRGTRHSVHVWREMLTSISRTNRTYLVYGYLKQEERNWKMYKRGGRSTNLYEGVLANGGIGGVDFVPVKNLMPPISYLTNFAERRQAS